MDDNGWFVTLLMYIGMLIGVLLKGPRCLVRRYPRASIALVFAVCGAAAGYVDFALKLDAHILGPVMIISIILGAAMIAFGPTSSENAELEPEPAFADPDDWLTD